MYVYFNVTIDDLEFSPEYLLTAPQTKMLQRFSQRHTGLFWKTALVQLSSTPPAFKGLHVGPSEQVMGKVVWVVTGRFGIRLAG